jgi:metal-responsive CopG/Arc/MetJ family transcriptional regulator
MQEKKEAIIQTRVPADLKKAVKSVVDHCGYMNESDFFRDAIREKIKQDFGLDDFLKQQAKRNGFVLTQKNPKLTPSTHFEEAQQSAVKNKGEEPCQEPFA